MKKLFATIIIFTVGMFIGYCIAVIVVKTYDGQLPKTVHKIVTVLWFPGATETVDLDVWIWWDEHGYPGTTQRGPGGYVSKYFEVQK